MEYQVSGRAPFPLYLLNVSVTFVSLCFFPSIIFLFSLCSRASPRFHLPQTDCHGLKEETPCSSAQLLVWNLRQCPYPGSERDESAPSLLCPHSLLDSFPVTKNEINHGRTTGALGKGTVHSADRQRQNERCQRRLWSLQGTARGNLTGVLPLRSPLTPQPPPCGAAWAVPRTLALLLFLDSVCGPGLGSQLLCSQQPGPAMLVNNNEFSLPCSSLLCTFNQECYPRLLPRPHLDFLFVAIISF